MRYLGYLGFLSLFLVVGVICHIYIWRRMIKATHAQPLLITLVSRALAIFVVLLITMDVLKAYLPVPIMYVVVNIPYIWLAMMMLLVVLFGLTDLTLFIGKLSFKVLSKPWFPEERMIWIQRIRMLLVLVTVLVLTCVAVFNGSKNPKLVPVDVVLDKLPAEFDGFKIVHLSDLHVNTTRSCDFLVSAVDTANRAEPDLVVVTGDLVDKHPDKIGSCVATLAKLKATHGVFYVTGNHEYYTGVVPWIFFLQELGLQWLHNERVLIEKSPGVGFELLGIDDLTANKFASNHGADLAKASKGRDTNLVSILLSHQPRIIQDAAREGIDLVLSGHVHGGQIWPFEYLVLLQQPYLKGLHRRPEGTQIYINQGTGFWGPPARLGSFNEVTLLRLKRS